MAVTKRTRYEVLRRDNHQCRYCGATAPEAALTIDHVAPVSLGGSDDPANLVAACADCNAGKASSNPDAPLVATVSDDQIRWAKALEAAAAEMLADREALHERTQAFFDEWDKWRNGGEPLPLPESWRSSVDRWLAAGLPLQILCDDIDIAMDASKVPAGGKFVYLAGIAWNQVRELQARAAQQVEVGGPPQCSNCGGRTGDMYDGCHAVVDADNPCRTCGRPLNADHSPCCRDEKLANRAYRLGYQDGRWEASVGRDLVAYVIDGGGNLMPHARKLVMREAEGRSA